MVVAVGEIETRKLLDDLIIIAQGKNELNEKNSMYGKVSHGDGWGLAYLNSDDKWTLYKSLQPIYQDKKLSELKSIKTKAVILHVRRATTGSKSLQNTQPFLYRDKVNEIIFAHNGTIYDDFSISDKYIEGNSDSAKWFNRLLKEYCEKETLQNSLSLENYSLANFVFATSNKIIIGEKFKQNPVYSTMKYYIKGKDVVVSSEILPTHVDKKWRKINNNSLIEISF